MKIRKSGLLYFLTVMGLACHSPKASLGQRPSWPDPFAEPNIVLFKQGPGDTMYALDVDTIFLYRFWNIRNDMLESIKVYYGDSMNTKMVRSFHSNGMIYEHADRFVREHDFLNKSGRAFAQGMYVSFWESGTLNEIGYGDSLGRYHGNHLYVDPDGTVRKNTHYNHGKLMKSYYYSKTGELDSLVVHP